DQVQHLGLVLVEVFLQLLHVALLDRVADGLHRRGVVVDAVLVAVVAGQVPVLVLGFAFVGPLGDAGGLHQVDGLTVLDRDDGVIADRTLGALDAFFGVALQDLGHGAEVSELLFAFAVPGLFFNVIEVVGVEAALQRRHVVTLGGLDRLLVDLKRRLVA